jgi:hypothetical protein
MPRSATAINLPRRAPCPPFPVAPSALPAAARARGFRRRPCPVPPHSLGLLVAPSALKALRGPEVHGREARCEALGCRSNCIRVLPRQPSERVPAGRCSGRTEAEHGRFSDASPVRTRGGPVGPSRWSGQAQTSHQRSPFSERHRPVQRGASHGAWLGGCGRTPSASTVRPRQ